MSFVATDGGGFELHNNGGIRGKGALRHRKPLGSRSKPTPSKWDDAQKWLAGFSSGRGVAGGDHHKRPPSKPRNSNADDRKLLASLSQRARDSYSSVDGVMEDDSIFLPIAAPPQDEGETKMIDYWRSSKPIEDSPPAVVARSICLRDAGTEMTPIASKEPSRTGTPLRATTPVLKSPISSRSSTPGRCRQGAQQHEGYQAGTSVERRNEVVPYCRSTAGGWSSRGDSGIGGGGKLSEISGSELAGKPNSLESRATAWDEAERAKYMARYKREEVKIQAWENHEKRKAEVEMKRMEVKAERIRARAQDKCASKLASARRMAEERRANAEAKLNERAARTTERADYIRRTGHLPSSFFSFKLPSLCN